MSKLQIAPDLALPHDVVTSTSVVFGGKGMGKTNLGSVIVEELTKARLRWSFLDPMGVAWGLRHSKDGKSPGVECVILGGIHGDVPIDPQAGEVVADLVVDESPRTIIDFSRDANGIPWSKADKIRFVTAYAHRLFRRQGEIIDRRRREPMLQIVDEAARYIPQVIPHGSVELAACVGEFEQIAEEGRNIGLGIAFLTQRSARINKSVSELADVLFAFRTVGPNSVAAIIDWLGEHMAKERAKELAGKIRELDVGQCLVVSPGWLKISERVVQIRERETFDSSSTPKPGEQQRRVSGAPARPDLESFKARMTEVIERAKAEDPKELKKRGAELEKDLRLMDKSRSVVSSEMIFEEYQRGREVGLAEGRRDAMRDLRELMVEQTMRTNAALSTLREWAANAVPLLNAADTQWERVRSLLDGSAPAHDAMAEHNNRQYKERAPARPPIAAPRPQPTVAQRPTPSVTPREGVTGVEQKILNTLKALEELGISPVDKTTAGALVGYHLRAKSYANAMGSLRTAGYVEYPGTHQVGLTTQGRTLATSQLSIAHLDDLHQIWFERLGPLARRILEPIIAAYKDREKSVDNEWLAEHLGYHPRAKSFANMKGRLRTLGLIDYPSTGKIIATHVLFPAGLY